MKEMLILIIMMLPSLGFTQGTGDYLILNDIGEYVFRPKRIITIGNAGVLVPTGHFAGHGDMTYEGIYIHPQTYIGVTVQVTQHSGSDSDRWLLHEVEDGYRDSDKLEETLDTNVQIRTIDGNNLFFIGIYGGKSYTWISNNNIVIDIGCSSCPNTKPEPLEVVRAYLAKFPSSITMTDAEAKSRAHNEQWLKDEMERRIWLSEKWMALIKAQNKPDELDKVRKHLEVFLKYREKYLGVKVTDKELSGLIRAEEKRDVVGMEEKVKGYREWWDEHKADPLQNVPGN